MKLLKNIFEDYSHFERYSLNKPLYKTYVRSIDVQLMFSSIDMTPKMHKNLKKRFFKS